MEEIATKESGMSTRPLFIFTVTCKNYCYIYIYIYIYMVNFSSKSSFTPTFHGSFHAHTRCSAVVVYWLTGSTNRSIN
jgi:hypothetical protein